jgi:glycosyltransferase involved in cell wall biosynthesis
MFPPLLQEKIAVQFEGFDIAPPLRDPNATAQDGRPFTIAFSARDLSSAKGFETYMRLVDRLVREGDGAGARFIAIGDANGNTYGYEQQWVQRRYQGKVASFRDHLLKAYPAASVVEFPGHLPYPKFAALLAEIDLFLYPLRHGVANWGLMEILARGGCVIASNWGFAPELVQHDVNGLLAPDNDDAWVAAIRKLRNDPASRARYSKAAVETGQRYHIANVAPRFMQLFRRAMAQRTAPLLAAS